MRPKRTLSQIHFTTKTKNKNYKANDFFHSECTICKIFYRHRRGLDAHAFEEHSGPKTCKQCEEVFQSNSILRRHTLEIHERVRNVKECPHCPLVFKSKTKLERHSGTHPVLE